MFQPLNPITRFMNSSSENLAHIAKFPFVEIALGATRADYLRNLKGCDLNVTNSQHETYCISAVESMAYGQPLIAPNGVTFPEITGRKSGATAYPYLFDDLKQQKSMLIKLLTDRSERLKWGKVLSKYVRSAYASTLWTQRYIDLFEHLTDFNLAMPDRSRAIVAKEVKAAKTITLRRLCSLLQTRYRVLIGGSQSLTMTKLLRLMREMNYSVTFENGEQIVRYQ